MAHPILMPKPGQMTEECVLVAWHRGEGDEVHRGDVLFEIETDKSNMDVEAFDDGVLLARLVEEGQTVPVNAVVAFVGDAGEIIPDEVLAAAIATHAPAAGPSPSVAPVGTMAPASESPSIARAGAVTGTSPATVASSAVAAATAPSLAAAAGAAPAAATPGAAAADAAASARVAISPRATRLAAGAGLDPRSIAGTGPGGRIVERDVQAAIASRDAADGGARSATVPRAVSAPGDVLAPGDALAPAAVSAPAAVPHSAPAAGARPASVPGADGDEEPRPLSRMRRVIADRLTLSATTIPQFSVTVAVDVTRLLALRQQLKEAGTSLTVTDFVLAATAQTLAEFPDVNSRTDGVSVWPRRRVHLGVAVSLPAGLVVPVIRDADRLGVVALHERASALASGAREGSLGPDDMTGSTFTVSNLGMFGVDEFSAIVNPGESAILAVSAAVPTPAVLGDGIAIRSIMKLTLSADHRLVDGEMGARFLAAIRRRLEDTEAFRRDLVNA